MWIWGFPYKVAEGCVFLNKNIPKNSQLLERIQTEPLLSHVRQEEKERLGAPGPWSSPARGGPCPAGSERGGYQQAYLVQVTCLSGGGEVPPPSSSHTSPMGSGGRDQSGASVAGGEAASESRSLESEDPAL